jgi:hypothetical protein
LGEEAPMPIGRMLTEAAFDLAAVKALTTA